MFRVRVAEAWRVVRLDTGSGREERMSGTVWGWCYVKANVRADVVMSRAGTDRAGYGQVEHRC